MNPPFAVKWMLALAPILVVLFLMIRLRWGGASAGAAAWFISLAIAFLFFGADLRLIAFAQTKGVLLALFVLYIVWMALLLYNVVSETGAIDVVGQGIQRVTSNRALQLLILAWVFSSFLQGVAGFGVPIAVVAPLLIGMGFTPVVAVAAPAIGHSWSVTFGDIASSFQALIAVTGLPGEFLAHWSGVFLGVATFMCGLAVVHLYGGLRSVARNLPAVLVIGTVMAGTQYLLAVTGLWSLAGFVAGMAGLVVGVLFSKLRIARGRPDEPSAEPADGNGARMSILTAVSAYLILIAIVTVAELVAPVHEILNSVKLTLSFPEVSTAHGWVVEAGTGKKISVFGHAGALLLYTSVIGFVLYLAKGHATVGAAKRIIWKTVDSGVPTSIGIVSMVCFALIMEQSGMTFLLAEGVSRVLGPAYPMLASAVGTLGAFMTGSNTNSNVIFGAFQQQIAEIGGLSVAVVLAAQTTGGSIGSMLAPAKILVGCSTVGLSGREGPVLGATIRYGLAMTTIIGLIALLANLVVGA